MIGAKEGATEAITKMTGSDVTDTVLQTTKENNFKGIEDHEICEIVTAAIQGTNRPATGDVLDQLSAVVTFQFDFCKKVSANLETLRMLSTQIQSYRVHVEETQIALVILANVEAEARAKYKGEYCMAVQNIRCKYGYNHKHDVVSITAMMKDFAAADAI